MWPGVGAGLPLLTWFISRPVHAGNVFVNNGQLTYEGRDWRVADAPQSCSNLNPTVHTTSATGDFVTFNFTGNAVSVRGPLTTLSTPMTVLLDGNIQSVAPPVLGSDGCGTLYTNTDIAGSQEHILTMVFAAASDSVQFSISGITLNTLDAVPDANALSPQTQSVSLPSLISSPAPSPTPSPSPTGGASTSDASSSVVLAMSSAAGNGDSSSSSASSSGVQTTAFVTKPGMTTVIIGAIVGTIMAMLGLLAFFIVLRRRISRTSARKLDQENTLGRWGRDLDDSKGKHQQDSGLSPIWNSKMGQLSQSDQGIAPQEKGSSIMGVPTTPILASPAPVEKTLPHQAVSIAYPSTASAYTIPLEAALQRRSSLSDVGSDRQSQPERILPQRFSRPALPPISVPPLPSVLPKSSSTPFSHTISTGRLATATTMDPTSAYSAAATVGDGPGQERRGLRVVNWSGTIETPGLSARKTPQPPPGFI